MVSYSSSCVIQVSGNPEILKLFEKRSYAFFKAQIFSVVSKLIFVRTQSEVCTQA